MAAKKESFGKWLWFDWVIFVGIVATVSIVFGLPGGFITGAIVGLIVSIIYSLTLKRLWALAFPDAYREWVCSKCGTVVPEDSTKCTKCGVIFSQNVVATQAKQNMQ